VSLCHPQAAVGPLAEAIARCGSLRLLDLSANPALADADARMSSAAKSPSPNAKPPSMARRSRVQVHIIRPLAPPYSSTKGWII
jgi:hypothetical protein